MSDKVVCFCMAASDVGWECVGLAIAPQCEQRQKRVTRRLGGKVTMIHVDDTSWGISGPNSAVSIGSRLGEQRELLHSSLALEEFSGLDVCTPQRLPIKLTANENCKLVRKHGFF